MRTTERRQDRIVFGNPADCYPSDMTIDAQASAVCYILSRLPEKVKNYCHVYMDPAWMCDWLQYPASNGARIHICGTENLEQALAIFMPESTAVIHDGGNLENPFKFMFNIKGVMLFALFDKEEEIPYVS